MDLRDPIWEGIAALITILGALYAVISLFFPDLKKGIEIWVKEKLATPTCAVITIMICILIVGVSITPFGIRAIEAVFVTPTPSPVPTPVYSYLFADNFNSGVLPDWLPSKGSWRMVNDQYTLTNIETSGTGGETFVGDVNWTDYHLGVLLNVSGQPHVSMDNEIVIFVRYKDQENLLALLLKNTGINFSQPDSLNASWIVPSEGKDAEIVGAGFSINDYYSQPVLLEIEVRGDLVTTFVNHVRVSRWSGASVPNGKVGLGIYSKNPDSHPSFDDFFVRQILP